MLVRNWMKTNPMLVSGDTLLQEAKRMLTDNNLHALPVVENGRLRGLLTRAHCLRAAHFVARTQSADEYNFFANRLKVKDVMLRRPATIEAGDTVEHCLHKGAQLAVGQFPVLEDGQVVGMISATEIFALAAHFLGAWERRSGVTLAPMELCPGMVGKIADIVESAGGEVQAIYPIGKAEPPDFKEKREKKVIVRFHSQDVGKVTAALEAGGFKVIESVEAPPRH